VDGEGGGRCRTPIRAPKREKIAFVDVRSMATGVDHRKGWTLVGGSAIEWADRSSQKFIVKTFMQK